MYLNITKPSKREERGGGGIFVMRTKLITLNSTKLNFVVTYQSS